MTLSEDEFNTFTRLWNEIANLNENFQKYLKLKKLELEYDLAKQILGKSDKNFSKELYDKAIELREKLKKIELNLEIK